MEGTKFYMWQNRMCISYLLRFNQIKRFLELNGWVAIDDICEADYCIIGACGAFLPDFDRYRNKVAEVTDLKKSKLVIFGCLPVIDKKFYKDTTPEGTLFIHSRRPEQIEKLVGESKVPWSEVELNGRFRDADYVHNILQRSYVLIQEGCNEGCVYCPHWLSIGRERSRPLAEIVEEVSQAYARGDREFVLEGNNAGSWGLDFKPPASYPEMLEAVMAATGESRIIIGDFAPKWVLEYGEAIVHPRINDLKIPIQTTSSRVLERLGRTPEVKGIAPTLKAIRDRVPDAFLRTEIIIGLPGSTEEELYDTLDFVVEHFDKVSCFSFDLHPSTKIARMDIALHDDKTIARHVLLAMRYLDGKPVKAAFDNRGNVCNILTSKLKSVEQADLIEEPI